MQTEKERGRPSKLTQGVRDKLIQAIKAGNYLNAACDYAGIDYSNFRRWMQRGESQTKGEFRDFRDAINAAESEVEVRVVALWQKNISEDWRAAENFLAKRFPERWSPSVKVRVQVEQAVDAELNLLFSAIADDPTIPNDVKLKLIEVAENLQGRAEVAAQN